MANKGQSSQGYSFSSGHVWMWELDCEESWAPKNWCFWTVVLEKTLGSPLDCKEIQPVHPKGDQSWVFIGRTDVEAETLLLWPRDVKNWVIGNDPDGGKDWGQEKGMTEDEMVGCHHRLDGHGFGWTPGISNKQGGLTCCSSWGHRVRHEWATELKESESEVTQLCLTLCDPMDCSLQGSSIRGIFKARVLEWVAISFSRGSSRPRDQTQVSQVVGRYFYCLSHQGTEWLIEFFFFQVVLGHLCMFFGEMSI